MGTDGLAPAARHRPRRASCARSRASRRASSTCRAGARSIRAARTRRTSAARRCPRFATIDGGHTAACHFAGDAGFTRDERRRAREVSVTMSELCCRSSDLDEALPRRSRASSRRARGARQGRRRRLVLDVERGRDARPRRRVGLRQVDDRPLRHAPHRADVAARSTFEGSDVAAARRAATSRRSAATCRSSSRTRTRA